MERRQATNKVLMVRPASFGFNSETAANNHFQNAEAQSNDTAVRARREFDDYVDLLRRNGVDVWVIQDTPKPYTPDSIFPNNWFSTHITGELILYPMFAPNRQKERKLSALATVGMLEGVTKIVNLSGFEKEHLYLEGTGSMCLDRVHKKVYYCASERSSEKVVEEYCSELDYTSLFFHSYDSQGQPIYHTNVMMTIATEYAVVCLESIRDEEERRRVVESLEASGHEIVPITLEQVYHFAGNMLEVLDDKGQSLLLMSAAAKASLTPDQLRTLQRYSRILAPDLTTIETIGGGSARCMVAEIFI